MVAAGARVLAVFGASVIDVRLQEESARGVSSSGRIMPASVSPSSNETTLAFVYGTLKKGFSNHWLLEDHMEKGNVKFLGYARTKHQYPLLCGPFQVPFLLNVPSRGWHVHGEVYEVNTEALEHLDELEGVDKGHYMRLPLTLTGLVVHPSYSSSLAEDLGASSLHEAEVEAQAYFAHEEYTPVMAQACSIYLNAYTQLEAATYTRRKDRPRERTFLEHVRHWIDQQCSTSDLELEP